MLEALNTIPAPLIERISNVLLSTPQTAAEIFMTLHGRNDSFTPGEVAATLVYMKISGDVLESYDDRRKRHVYTKP